MTAFVQAAHFYEGRRKPIRLVVVHDMEAPENATTAEGVAAYFAREDSREASAHYCIDSDTVVQCVRDVDTAYGAKGANADGLHFEHAGYARQTPKEWVDPYGRSMLALSAALVAGKCAEFGIPVRRLTPAQIRAGLKGICGHGDITAAYPPGTGHTDPGGSFPWPYYLDLVRAGTGTSIARPTPQEEDDMSPEQMDALVERVAKRAAELVRKDLAVLQHGDPGTPDGGSHKNNLDAIGRKVGLAQ